MYLSWFKDPQIRTTNSGACDARRPEFVPSRPVVVMFTRLFRDRSFLAVACTRWQHPMNVNVNDALIPTKVLSRFP